MTVARVDNFVSASKTILFNIHVVLTNITVEPLLVFFLIPNALLYVPLVNLFLEKACRISLKLNGTLCDSIATGDLLFSDHEEIALQSKVTTMISWTSIVQGGISGFLLLYFGAWSDRCNIRRPFIILPFIGESLRMVGCLFTIYHFEKLNLEWTGFINSLFSSISGGLFVFLMAVYNYVSIISTNQSRTVHFGAINVCTQICSTIGLGIGGISYRNLGLEGTFLLCLGSYIVGIIYIIFFVKDVSIKKKNPDEDVKPECFSRISIIVCDMWDTIMTVFKKRHNRLRLKIFLNVVIVILINGVAQGQTLTYFLVRTRYKWDEIDFSNLATVSYAASAAGGFLGLLVFAKYLKINDNLLAIVPCVLKIVELVICSIATDSEVLYFVGKINGIIGTSQAIIPLLFGPLFNSIYQYTVNIFDGFFLLAAITLLIPVIIILTTANKMKEKTGPKEKNRTFFTNITVEPVLVLFLLPSILLTLSVANLHLEKACRVKLQFNSTVCDGLVLRNTSMYTPEQENIVQKKVASMNVWKTIIQSSIPVVLLISFGAWSDKRRKRKPFMILPVIGEIITVTGFLFSTYFFYEFSMEITGIIEVLPTALLGGWFTMFMAVFSYIADNSTFESRTVRIGAANIIINGSILVGMALSGVLYRMIGLYAIFSIVLIMYISSLIYTTIAIKEKGQIKQTNKSKYAFCLDFFNVAHIKSTFAVAFRPRKKNHRKRILISLLLLVLILGPIYGEVNVIYLFARKRFQWSEVEFSIYYTVNVILHMIGTVFSLTFFSKCLKIDDSTLGIISGVSKFFSAFVFTFAPNEIVFYSGLLLEISSGTSFIAIRSIASKLVEPDELGKLSALTGICEALMPIAYGSIYNLIYKSTIDTLPGTFYLVGSVLAVPTVGLFCWFNIQHRNDQKELDERKNQEQLLQTTEIQ
ncbi:hypothetical protein FQR65_LT05862 [Abscondita terminalis]|nr:hypothetical protein FQR65_LT05862 [Abscondita terminalis]